MKGPYILIRQIKHRITRSGEPIYYWPYAWRLKCLVCARPWTYQGSINHQDALAEAQAHLDRHWDGWKYEPQSGDDW